MFWPPGTFCRAGKMCRLKALCRAFVQSLMQALSKTVQGFTLRPQSACLKVRDVRYLHAWHRDQAELSFNYHHMQH